MLLRPVFRRDREAHRGEAEFEKRLMVAAATETIGPHHSNIVPWHFLRERKGVVIKWAPVDDEGNFLIEEFEKLLTDRTKIVAITQMSNALGTVVPVKEVVKIAH
eukprot:gene40354-54575_t